jgi:DNA-binding CsgD family transcriptional regulator
VSVRLTPREHEVLHLLAASSPTRVMARDLGVSDNTVRTHVAHLLDKLGVHDRERAVDRAVELGLLGPGIARAHGPRHEQRLRWTDHLDGETVVLADDEALRTG